MAAAPARRVVVGGAAAIDEAVLSAGARAARVRTPEDSWREPEDAAQDSAPGLQSKRRKLVSKKTGLSSNNLIDENTFLGKLVQSTGFENVALTLIITNAAWIGVDIDQRDREGAPVTPLVLMLGENFFCFGFTGELLLRFLSYRRKWDFFTDPSMKAWNAFDFLLVAMMIGETWVLPALDMNMENMKFLSIIRLLRLLRLSRIFRMVPELGVMVQSMISAVRGVSFTLLLLLGIMYVFSIIFTQWVRDAGSDMEIWCVEDSFEEGGELCFADYFGNIGLSFLALAQILIFDDTFEIIRPVLAESPLHGFGLLVYMLFACFTVLNMLIGIICDIVDKVKEVEQEKSLRLNMEDLLLRMDEDNSGTVSSEEFEHHAMESMEQLGLSPDMLRNAFDILDQENEGSVKVNVFLDFVFKCIKPMEAQDLLLIGLKIEQASSFLGVGKHHSAVTGRERKKHQKGGAAAETPVLRCWAGEAGWMQMRLLAEAEDGAGGPGAADGVLDAETRDCRDRLESLRRCVAELGVPPATPPPTSHEVPPQHATVLAGLAPALRVLNAQLFGLRAECKAANLRRPGVLADIDEELRGNRPWESSRSPGLEDLVVEVMQQVYDILIDPGHFELDMPSPSSTEPFHPGLVQYWGSSDAAAARSAPPQRLPSSPQHHRKVRHAPAAEVPWRQEPSRMPVPGAASTRGYL